MNVLGDLREIKRGDPITAEFLNSLVRRLKAANLQPGQFQSATLNVQHASLKSGGGGTTTLRTARVTTAITAATGAATADWGSGQAELCDTTTGEPGGGAVDVDNEWPVAFADDAMVKLDMSHSPPRVVGGTCTALDAETFWGDA